MQEVLCLGAAYIAGLVANRLSFPPLVGYLIAGYVLHTFNVAAIPTLAHLADIGIEL
jgi:glutathione-regulated potassium-efflux system ancillary protein KefC